MIRLKQDQKIEIRHHVRGGEGDPEFRELFSKAESGNRADLLAVISLQPGESIGLHSHDTNAELYYILSGEVTVTEEDKIYKLLPGDAAFCGDGHIHGMANDTQEPVSVLAVIIPDR